MRWPGIETIYGEFLRKTPVFSTEKRWEDLHTRVIEHVCFLKYIALSKYLIGLEYSCRCAILHTNNTITAYLPPGPYAPANGRDACSVGGVRYNMGSSRPTCRNRQLQKQKKSRRRDERLEFRHAEVAELGREDMDGDERCTGSTVTGKSISSIRSSRAFSFQTITFVSLIWQMTISSRWP